ncbi:MULTISPECIES: peptidoglycan-binding domain-containing protein [Marivita]|uniref:Peptidoglycan-binding protein n=1 Tax=Marivita cryptomonadis TaxID=505252 RepID=A0A9Q2RVA5_9RHOB|nr:MULTISPECIES: peptidoglycan-binding protein [Marivita]MBM2319744.1 peptidoglycan-binding protein [Marivita cryptomonadis]MBM2329323.1 peptidoglycan-binding protein [Marivita cryptomonadis]MBM2338911.1 peptidoglycan-binding protein [Marivita cryptomonadis]MBM2343569.1 peptidoglycan-binding protein [Marivita cryptomonadis]MBM2348246.1 peptidoglycan-binding protein [Marivita cryptomonadis]
MIVRPLAIFVALVFSAPSLAEENPLQSELDDIERQLVEVEALTSRYDGGLILGLIEARREALLLARTVVQNRINAEAGGATIEVVVSAIQTDERRAEQLLGEMAAAQERISQAESEAASSGGLVQALALSRLETERLTLAQLQMGYLQARYGIAFPIAQMPSEQVETSVIADEGAVEASGAEGQSVVWADPGFPNTDYTLQPFEQAHRDGHQISGWWTIEAERAAIDDSPQITAVNYSQYDPNSFTGLTALVARCSEGETAFIFVQDDFLMADFRRNSFDMTLRVDDEAALQARWSSLTSNKGAGLFGSEAEAFIRTLYDANQLFIRLVESNGQRHDAVFDLSGAQAAFEEVAGACGWTTLSLSSDDYRAIQTLLNAGGFDAGTPDGQWGPASQRAMRAYQASVGLPETGAPDRATLETLGLNN